MINIIYLKPDNSLNKQENTRMGNVENQTLDNGIQKDIDKSRKGVNFNVKDNKGQLGDSKFSLRKLATGVGARTIARNALLEVNVNSAVDLQNRLGEALASSLGTIAFGVGSSIIISAGISSALATAGLGTSSTGIGLLPGLGILAAAGVAKVAESAFASARLKDEIRFQRGNAKFAAQLAGRKRLAV